MEWILFGAVMGLILLGRFIYGKLKATDQQKLQKKFQTESKKAEQILLDLNLTRVKVAQLEIRYKSVKDKVFDIAETINAKEKE